MHLTLQEDLPQKPQKKGLIKYYSYTIETFVPTV